MFSWFNRNDQSAFADTPTQRLAIDTDIANFQLIRQQLLATDSQIGLAASVDTLLYLAGFIGLGMNLTFACGLYLYATQYTSRKQQATDHEVALRKLINQYHHTLASGMTNLQDNATFLKLLAAIAPFVALSVLRLDKLNINPNLPLNEDFIRILSSSPHRIHLLLPQTNTFVDADDAPFFLATMLPQPLKPLANHRYFRLFPQVVAEVNRTIYGVEVHEMNLPSMRAP